jgi:3-deoxy-manno-octulosonate cytidylyltransferase (CMP-KDO synthetase)
MKVVLIIPARYQSSRFPGKPLTEILGKTMIERVYHQCAEAFPTEGIYVATEDNTIVDFCTSANIKSVLTSDTCLTGTDRVAETAETVHADVYINVQGDEPVFNPEDIKLLMAKVDENPNQIYCGYCEITEQEMFNSRSIPKVVFGLNEQLLYMSRSPIPGNKNGTFGFSNRQVCAYAFPKEALRIFKAEGTKTPLEQEEDLELLRFLEMGYPVQMVRMSAASIAVDHPEDVEKVIKRLTNEN